MASLSKRAAPSPITRAGPSPAPSDAVYSVRASATVDNFGQLTATLGDGVGFYNGGALINEIGGVTDRVWRRVPPLSISNNSRARYKMMAPCAATETGAYLQAGGTVVNGVNNTSALLQGGNFGVYLSNLPGSTSLELVTNYGRSRQRPQGPMASISTAMAAR